MTWSKFAKNTILHDGVESFCLVCDSRLKLNAIDNHVDNKEHKAKLTTYPYLDKYPGDRIRKLKLGYYCEFCSIVLNTATKVTMHIETKHHLNNKGSLTLRRHNTEDVFVFDDVMIEENAWHAIHEGCCSVCAVEAIDDKHKQEHSHLLKLIQSKVEFVKNGLYRKIDDATFQCVTCNREFSLNDLGDHFVSDNHIKAYTSCKIKVNKADDGSDIKVEDFEVNTDLATKLEEVNVPQDDSDEIKRFTKENQITYNAGISHAFCRVCEIKIPASLRNLKEHVSGSKHTNVIKSQKQKPAKITKVALKTFIDEIVTIQNIVSQVFVINKTYCIEIWSFMMITKNSESVRCQVCEVNMSDVSIDDHIKTPRHTTKLEEMPVVTSLGKEEFIREPRPGIFHCGFCHLLILSWDDVEAHLKSSDHSYKKGMNNWRLEKLLPEIEEHENEKRAEILRMLMFRGFPFMRPQFDF